MDYPQIFYAVPLIIAFSLVYAGTRHELPKPIFKHAAHFGFGIVVFMVAIGCILELLVYLKG